MPRTSELPADIDAEELNELIAALAREHDIPNWVYGPDLVELDHIPQYIFGYNRGGVHDGLEMYKAGQKWRRRLIKELSQRPEFIEEFRADKRLDECIRELCEAKGLTFYPWEVPPWQAPDELPEDYDGDRDLMRMDTQKLPLAVALRRQLIAELEAAD